MLCVILLEAVCQVSIAIVLTQFRHLTMLGLGIDLGYTSKVIQFQLVKESKLYAKREL